MATPTIRLATFDDLSSLDDPDRAEIIDGSIVYRATPSNKPNVLRVAEVPHLWLVNPEEKILLVQRWSAAGYTTILAASSGQVVRAEPFEAIELRVDVLFGDDDD